MSRIIALFFYAMSFSTMTMGLANAASPAVKTCPFAGKTVLRLNEVLDQTEFEGCGFGALDLLENFVRDQQRAFMAKYPIMPSSSNDDAVTHQAYVGSMKSTLALIRLERLNLRTVKKTWREQADPTLRE